MDRARQRCGSATARRSSMTVRSPRPRSSCRLLSVDAKDLNEAIRSPAALPAKHGSIEVRPVRQLDVDFSEPPIGIFAPPSRSHRNGGKLMRMISIIVIFCTDPSPCSVELTSQWKRGPRRSCMAVWHWVVRNHVDCLVHGDQIKGLGSWTGAMNRARLIGLARPTT